MVIRDEALKEKEDLFEEMRTIDEEPMQKMLKNLETKQTLMNEKYHNIKIRKEELKEKEEQLQSDIAR